MFMKQNSHLPTSTLSLGRMLLIGDEQSRRDGNINERDFVVLDEKQCNRVKIIMPGKMRPGDGQ